MVTLSDHFNKALSHREFKKIWMTLFESSPKRGFGLAFLLTALPSALPLPAPGYSTPFGILILLLSLQMLMGRSSPWIPQWALNRTLSDSFVESMRRFLTRIFRWSEVLVKPRLFLFRGRPFLILSGVTIALMAILMIIPIPGTNTLPAFIIWVTGLALAEEDGLLLIFCIFGGVLAALCYTLLFFLMFHYGLSGIQEAWQWIQLQTPL
jgi:hypothetical protein